MTEIHQKREVKHAVAISPIVAGIAGIIAGGVAVAAAAFVLSDKKSQKKVQDTLGQAKDTVAGYIHTIKSHPVVENSQKKLAKVVEATKQAIINDTK